MTTAQRRLQDLGDAVRALAETRGGLDALLTDSVPPEARGVLRAAVTSSERRADALARATAEPAPSHRQ